MKIAYVITRSDSIGGASIHLLDLADGMQKRGLDVHVFVGGDGPFCDLLSQYGIPFTQIPSLVREISPVQDLRAYVDLKRLLRRFQPDLVHLHSSKAGVIGRLASRALEKPCVFTAHGWAYTEGVALARRKFYRYIEQRLAPLASAIITVSDYDRNLALANQVGSESQLITILNGVRDMSRHAPLKLKSKPVRLIMVARFDAQKDHLTVIHSLSKLQSLDWELEFVGDGPLKNNAEQVVNELGLGKKVIFSGIQRDIPDRLFASDIFILSSRWEGLPLSILEAMSAALPVVATNVGGVPETIEDGCTGYLVETGDTNALAHKLELLIKDDHKRNALGAQGRKLYEEKFALKRMIDETEQVYAQILASNGKTGMSITPTNSKRISYS